MEGVAHKLRTALSLLENAGSIKALVTWPMFSVTSFNVVSRLAKQGVLPRTVLDVGANVGQFAVASANLLPNARVHSFEPEPKSVARLRKNVSGLENVTVYPFALGDCEGEAALHVYSESQMSSILPLAGRDAYPDAQELYEAKVKVSTLDLVFADVELQPPVLLKLDVQGYEAQTIRGGAKTLECIDYIVLEAGFKPRYEGESLFMDIVRMMEEYGFRFESPVNCAAPSNGEILEMDALFVRDV